MKRDKSIITDNLDECFICKRPREAIHEVFFGHSNRKKSIKDGLYVPLCSEHHNTSKKGAHNNRGTNLFLKRVGQLKYEEKIGTREEFIKRYGKSWL